MQANRYKAIPKNDIILRQTFRKGGGEKENTELT